MNDSLQQQPGGGYGIAVIGASAEGGNKEGRQTACSFTGKIASVPMMSNGF